MFCDYFSGAKDAVVDKQRVLNASTTTIAPMDIDTFNFNCKLNEMEEDEWGEEQDLTGTLLRDPREGTARQVLYRRQNNRAYITTMSFDVATFHVILEAGFAAAQRVYIVDRNREDVPAHNDGGLLGNGREGPEKVDERSA
ncbi:hypothetical protein C8R45DRAFT_927697 [Mycena sanguinolenta]|nr:hypothetical protein C8R45DRAFT_927697 [Mycena sanguinolenta]